MVRDVRGCEEGQRADDASSLCRSVARESARLRVTGQTPRPRVDLYGYHIIGLLGTQK